MEKIQPSNKIYLALSTIPHAGRGVFAGKFIHKNEIIERCPVVFISESQLEDLKKTELFNYFFQWGENMKDGAICLGHGSLYNHLYTPNATYIKYVAEGFIDFVAIKDIPKNTEITVNYNHGNPDDKTPLWIESIPPAE